MVEGDGHAAVQDAYRYPVGVHVLDALAGKEGAGPDVRSTGEPGELFWVLEPLPHQRSGAQRHDALAAGDPPVRRLFLDDSRCAVAVARPEAFDPQFSRLHDVIVGRDDCAFVQP